MKSFLIASLIAACATPVTQAPPQNPKPAEPVFEIEHKKDAGDAVTSTAILYADGAWTYEDSTGIKHAGQLPVADVAAVRAKLAGATWTVEPDEGVHCMAMAADYYQYSALGKPVWTARTCSGTHLDATSQAAFESAVTLLTSVAKA